MDNVYYYSVTGTMFVMWLGEKITDRGVGNGISLLIMIGIIASYFQSLMQEFTSSLQLIIRRRLVMFRNRDANIS